MSTHPFKKTSSNIQKLKEQLESAFGPPNESKSPTPDEIPMKTIPSTTSEHEDELEDFEKSLLENEESVLDQFTKEVRAQQFLLLEEENEIRREEIENQSGLDREEFAEMKMQNASDLACLKETLKEEFECQRELLRKKLCQVRKVKMDQKKRDIENRVQQERLEVADFSKKRREVAKTEREREQPRLSFKKQMKELGHERVRGMEYRDVREEERAEELLKQFEVQQRLEVEAKNRKQIQRIQFQQQVKDQQFYVSQQKTIEAQQRQLDQQNQILESLRTECENASSHDAILRIRLSALESQFSQNSKPSNGQQERFKFPAVEAANTRRSTDNHFFPNITAAPRDLQQHTCSPSVQQQNQNQVRYLPTTEESYAVKEVCETLKSLKEMMSERRIGEFQENSVSDSNIRSRYNKNSQAQHKLRRSTEMLRHHQQKEHVRVAQHQQKTVVAFTHALVEFEELLQTISEKSDELRGLLSALEVLQKFSGCSFRELMKCDDQHLSSFPSSNDNMMRENDEYIPVSRSAKNLRQSKTRGQHSTYSSDAVFESGDGEKQTRTRSENAKAPASDRNIPARPTLKRVTDYHKPRGRRPRSHPTRRRSVGTVLESSKETKP